MVIFKTFLIMIIWTLNVNLVFSQCNHSPIQRTISGIYEVPVTISGKITFDFIFDIGCSKKGG